MPQLRTAIALLSLLTLFTASLAQPNPPPPPTTASQPLDSLLRLIAERLDIATAVAKSKWNSKRPIEDLQREAQLLQSIQNQAPQYSLHPTLAAAFFSAQINASKTVQKELHTRWTTENHPPFENPPSLQDDIRPKLDQLTPALLKALASSLPVLQNQNGRSLLYQRAKSLLPPGRYPTKALRQALQPLVQQAAHAPVSQESR
jgi:chorismate mutase